MEMRTSFLAGPLLTVVFPQSYSLSSNQSGSCVAWLLLLFHYTSLAGVRQATGADFDGVNDTTTAAVAFTYA